MKPFSGDDAEDNMKSLSAAMPMMVAGALYRLGLELKNKAHPLTPMDTGALRRSLFVTIPNPTAGVMKCRVGADGRSAPYARFVHEMPKSTNWSEPGTGPKYLERPFNEMKNSASKDLARDVMNQLKRNSVKPMDKNATEVKAMPGDD
jgi:hypothetical protein